MSNNFLQYKTVSILTTITLKTGFKHCNNTIIYTVVGVCVLLTSLDVNDFFTL